MTALGYETAVAESMDMRRRVQQAEQSADYYRLLAEDRDEELRRLSLDRHFPHYEIHQESDGVHVIYEDRDPRYGVTHTDHVEPSWRAAWIWAERHHRVMGGQR